MRRRSLATTLVAVTVGLAARAAVRRIAARRASAITVTARPVPVAAVASAAVPAPDGVVLPFARRVTAAAPAPAQPARCGDSGGRTKAGAPCAARATPSGRCHHHRLAA